MVQMTWAHGSHAGLWLGDDKLPRVQSGGRNHTFTPTGEGWAHLKKMQLQRSVEGTGRCSRSKGQLLFALQTLEFIQSSVTSSSHFCFLLSEHKSPFERMGFPGACGHGAARSVLLVPGRLTKCPSWGQTREAAGPVLLCGPVRELAVQLCVLETALCSERPVAFMPRKAVLGMS